MKLTIERAPLLKALGHVQSVVERRTTIPILANMLLNAGDGTLGLTATDMDLAIDEKITADIGQSGGITAPAHTLFDIVRKLPEGAEVSFETSGEGRVDIHAGRSRFSLSSLPGEEFPSMAGGDMPHRFAIAASELRRLIDRTRFAISTEETRYYLNGIFLHEAESGGEPVLRAVATDGHRLARAEMPLPEGAGGMPGIIVPRKAVGEVRKLIEDSSDGVDIELSETRLQFSFDRVVLSTKLIDGTFPDYERVIPTGNDKVLRVARDAFAEAVDRVSTISTEKSRAIKLSLGPGTLTLSATSPENGTATEEVEVSYDAEPLEIGFNSRYLLDIAGQIEGDEAEFALADGASPTVVHDTTDPSALYVLMPMRV